ncbi:MAG: hypothetical protein JXQ96_05525 [Cyclobacteriaceae bacterium]
MRRFLLTVLMLSFIFSDISCQNLDDILQSHYKSWGQEVISQVRTVRLEMVELRGLKDQKKYQVSRKRPNMVRLDGLWKEHPYVHAYDGKGYWSISPWLDTEASHMTTEIEKEKLAKSLDIDSPLFKAQKEGIIMEHIGEKIYDEKEYHILRIFHHEKRFLDYFIDMESYQIFKTEERDIGNEKYVYEEVFFKNYKPQAGINIALEYDIRSKTGNSNVVIDNIVLGHGIPSSFFRRPIKPE